MTVGEILSLALAMGLSGHLGRVSVSCDLITFFRYLLLAQEQLCSLIRWGHNLPKAACPLAALSVLVPVDSR